MAIKSKKKYHYVILLVILSAFVLNGCGVLRMGLELTQGRETKLFHERLDEISAELEKRLEMKYGEEIDALGYDEYYRDEYIFWFRSQDTGVKFDSSYKGDYLNRDFPEEMAGEFQDNYWRMRINYAVKQHFMPDVEEIFSGQFADLRIQALVKQGIGIEDMDEFYAWASDWVTDLSAYYDIHKLNYELNAEPSYDFLGVYFKDVTKETADELYQEVFNLVMKFKEAGIEDLDISLRIYDEKYLTDKRVNLENFDENQLDNISKEQRITFTMSDVIINKDISLTDINTIEDLKKVIIVSRRNGNNVEFWLGGKDGN